MKKADLINLIAFKTDVSVIAVRQTLDALGHTVQQALDRADEVTLPGIGHFSVRDRGARACRHPQTGEAIEIPAKRVPVFKAARALKDAVG